MLLLAVMFAAGISVSAAAHADLRVLFLAGAILAAGALAAAGSRYATLLISAAFFISGWAVHQAHLASIAPDRIRAIYDSGQITSGEPVGITGTVSGGPESASDGFFFRVDVESIAHPNMTGSASGTVRTFAPVNSPEMAEDYERLQLRGGTRVRIACGLNRDDGYRNPGVLPRRTVLDWQEIDATCTLKSPLLVEKLGTTGFGFAAFVSDFREGLTVRFREMFSPPVSGVMIASMLGNKHFLDKGTADVFREGGTFHVLVISGLHITFIGGLAAVFVALFTRRRGVQFVEVCGFLWLYTIAVGAEVPVVRASLMFTLLWLALVIHRTGSLANALGACGLILLAWRPDDLFTPSFQLTFVSVSAIVMAGFPIVRTLRSIGEWTPSAERPFPAKVPRWLRRFCETLYWNRKRWEIDSARNIWSANLFKSPFFTVNRTAQKCAAYLFEGVLISTIVQIAMLPVVVHYFHRVTPVSVPMNLWTGVLIALESFASLIAVAFSFVSDPLALPFVHLTEAFQWLLVNVPAMLADLRWLSFRVPVYADHERWLYGAYLLSVLALSLAAFLWSPFVPASRMVSKFLLLPIAMLVLVGCVMVFHPYSEPRADGLLHVEFLDVGQGDSALVTFPNGETMLIDGGGRPSFRDEDDELFEPDLPSIGEMVVCEFLWEKGYSKVDYIVATHADADHIQGLADVARNFQVGQVWVGLPDRDDPDYARLASVLERSNVPVRRLSEGDGSNLAGVNVEVLHPPAGDLRTPSENDRSLVIRLAFGNRSFLFTGDIEQLAEAEITASGTDVVKVPHHGSRTSSTPSFVESTRPQFAVIPVGRTSVFGHPHPEVVERWRAIGAGVLTTGNEGTISFSTDGNVLVVTSFVRNSDKLIANSE